MKITKDLLWHFLLLFKAAACVMIASHLLLSFGIMLTWDDHDGGRIVAFFTSFLVSLITFFVGVPFALFLGFKTTLPVLILVYLPIAHKLWRIKARRIFYGFAGVVCAAICGALAPNYTIKLETLEYSVPLILFYAMAGFFTSILHHYFLLRREIMNVES